MSGALMGLCLLALRASAAPIGFHEDVVVTGERAPELERDAIAALTVLRREDLERAPAETLAEALDSTPSVEVLFAAPVGPPPIVVARGFFGGGEAEYVRLMVDGMPLHDVESGLAEWWLLRAAQLERVEVLRGPGSAAYGDTALGGVVQAFTRHDAGGFLAASAGAFGSAAFDASRTLTLDGRTLLLWGSATRTDGGREHAHAAHGSLAAAWQPAGQGGWSAWLAGSARDRDDPGALPLATWETSPRASDPLFRFDHERAQRLRAALRWDGGGGDGRVRAALQASARDSAAVRTLLLAAGLGDRKHRDTDTAGVTASLDADRAASLFGREGHLRGGAEAGADRAQTGYRDLDDDGRVAGAPLASLRAVRTRAAAWAVQDWRPRPRLRVIVGARADWIRDTAGAAPVRHHALSPRAGLSVRLGPPGSSTALFAQAARAFKAPTLDQLYDPRPFPDFQGGAFTVSNDALRPQRATSLEAGLRHHGRRAHLDLAAYRLRVQDEIDFDLATFRYLNIGHSRHDGVEAALRLFPTARVSPALSYAFTAAEPARGENEGRQLKNVPRHLVKASVRARLPLHLDTEARLSVAGGRYFDEAASVRAPDLVRLDARVRRSAGRMEVRVDALNLLGRGQAELGYVLPDFTGGGVTYVVPGAGRLLRAALTWRF
jgi:outer membrane receptor protein involved in Fe transport